MAPMTSTIRFTAVCLGTLCLSLWSPGCQSVTTEKQSYQLSDGKSESILDTRLRKLEGEVMKYPLRSDLWYEIASLHYQKADYLNSATALTKAIELSPSETRYHYHLGRVYLQMRDLEAGEKSFRQALRVAGESRFSGPHAALGLTLAMKTHKDLPGAIEQFRKCIELEPQNLIYYYFLGSLYDMQGERESAVKHYQEYLARGGARYRRKTIQLLESLGVRVDEDQLPEAKGGHEEILDAKGM